MMLNWIKTIATKMKMTQKKKKKKKERKNGHVYVEKIIIIKNNL